MNRYIDADKFKQRVHSLWFTRKTLDDIIDEFPTADVVDVVRCKDCIHCPTMFLTDERTTFTAYGHCFEFGDNDFCSYGERRNNDKVHDWH